MKPQSQCRAFETLCRFQRLERDDWTSWRLMEVIRLVKGHRREQGMTCLLNEIS